MDKIMQKALNLKKKYKTSCPFDICREMDIKILHRDLPDSVNGFYFRLLKNCIIILNDSLGYEESRVTAAHELGHILLHGGTNSFQISTFTDIPVEKLERQADYFACCLLIDAESLCTSDSEDCLTVSDIACANRVPTYYAELYTHLI